MKSVSKPVSVLLAAILCCGLLVVRSAGREIASGPCDADGANVTRSLSNDGGSEEYPTGSPAFTAADADHDLTVTALNARLILRCPVGLEAFH